MKDKIKLTKRQIRKEEARKKHEKNRLKEWKEFLKDDQDWDYGFILKTFIYKLGRFKTYIKKFGHHEGDERIIAQVQEVITLLQRVYDDDSYDGSLEEHDKKWGKLEFNKTDEKGCSIWRRKNETPQNEKAERREFMKAHKESEKLRQDDLDKAFSLIAKNLQSWWD